MFNHITNSGEACPRRSKIGLLIFNHAFFFFQSDNIGTEITICSDRWLGCEKGVRFVWFSIISHNTN